MAEDLGTGEAVLRADMLALAGVFLTTEAADIAPRSWLSENSTLIVGIVGIIVSGVVGPTVAALLLKHRERAKDRRALIVARRDDLRRVLDEAARILGGAVSMLRPLLSAELAGKPAPKESRDFLAEIVPLGQRLRLRLEPTHPVVTKFDVAREKLVLLAEATDSQETFDSAVDAFEREREAFLESARSVLQAPLDEGKDI